MIKVIRIQCAKQVHDETRRYDMGLCMQLRNNADVRLVYFDKK